MKFEERLLRLLLLDLFSDQICLFKIPIIYEKENYNNSIKNFPKNLQISPTQKFEEYFIYLIGVQFVYNLLPESDPKKKDFEEYCKKIYTQIKYFIEKKEFSLAISLLNKNLKNYFENKSYIAELQNKKDIKLRCDKIFEKLVSNKIFCLINKEGTDEIKRKDYEESLKCLEEEYFKNYKIKKNADEDIYAKCLARKATLFIKVKNSVKCEEALEKLKNELPQQKKLIEQVQNEVNAFTNSLKSNKEIKEKNFKKNFIQSISEMNEEVKGFDQWDLAVEDYDINANIDIGIIDYIFS